MTSVNSIFLIINRYVRSFSYRVILLIYGIILAFLFPSLSIYLYVGLFILYFSYIILYLFYNVNVIIRSIFDLVFIAICLYGKPVDNISVIAMLFLPVANSINHTGRGRFSYVYLLGLIVIYVGMLFSVSNENIIIQILYVLIAFSSFGVIQWFTQKCWIRNNNEALLKDAVEDCYVHGIRYDKVYKRITQIFNEEKIGILDIFCFISHDDFKSLFVVNGSRFVYNYSISISESQFQKIQKDSVCKNISLTIDGYLYKNNIVIVAPATLFKDNNDKTSYLFVLCFENKPFGTYLFIENIRRELEKLSQYLYSERIIRLRKIENFEKIKDKGRFVDSAINTMHFIKNRLSSLQTLVDVVNEIDQSHIDCEHIKVAKVAAERSTIDINSILQKARYLLDKENNPFHYQPLESCSTRNMFAILRMVWENIFSNSNINVSNVEEINNELAYIKTSMEGVEILFSDIIRNMFKYQKGQSTCCCTCDSEFLIIVFKNDFVDKNAVSTLVKTYNQKDKEEIIKRKTFGVSNVKSFVSDMNILLSSSIEEISDVELFTITLKFKLIKDEDSSN